MSYESSRRSLATAVDDRMVGARSTRVLELQIVADFVDQVQDLSGTERETKSVSRGSR